MVHDLTRQLYEILGQVVNIETCQRLMETCNYDINAAMDEYYSNSHKYEAPKKSRKTTKASNSSKSGTRSSSSDPTDKFFKKYEDKECRANKNIITVDGVIQLCEDLDLDPSSREILILAWQCACSAQANITKDEFKSGMSKIFDHNLQKSSLTTDNISAKLTEINQVMDTPDQKLNFKSLYEFTFRYGKDPKQKSLDIEDAIEYWKMLFSVKGNYDNDMAYDGQFPNFPLFENFLTFLKESMVREEKPLKFITKDQWCQLLEFASNCSKNIREHNELSAWPVLIDEYVAWYKKGGSSSVMDISSGNNNAGEMQDVNEKVKQLESDSFASNIMF